MSEFSFSECIPLGHTPVTKLFLFPYFPAMEKKLIFLRKKLLSLTIKFKNQVDSKDFSGKIL